MYGENKEIDLLGFIDSLQKIPKNLGTVNRQLKTNYVVQKVSLLELIKRPISLIIEKQKTNWKQNLLS